MRTCDDSRCLQNVLITGTTSLPVSARRFPLELRCIQNVSDSFPYLRGDFHSSSAACKMFLTVSRIKEKSAQLRCWCFSTPLSKGKREHKGNNTCISIQPVRVFAYNRSKMSWRRRRRLTAAIYIYIYIWPYRDICFQCRLR